MKVLLARSVRARHLAFSVHTLPQPQNGCRAQCAAKTLLSRRRRATPLSLLLTAVYDDLARDGTLPLARATSALILPPDPLSRLRF
jgi:hypothetical protein